MNPSLWNNTEEEISMFLGDSDLKYEIHGSGTGMFDLFVDKQLTDGHYAHAFYSNVSITDTSKGTLFVYDKYVDYTVYMDDDGDGIIDREIEPTTIITNPPIIPARPDGPTSGKPEVEYTYTTSTIDPDGDQIYYWFDWGDGTNSSWVGSYDSGETAEASHSWSEKGSYNIRVKAKDVYDCESGWSDPLPVTMPKNKQSNNQQNSQSVGFQQSSSQLFLQILERMLRNIR